LQKWEKLGKIPIMTKLLYPIIILFLIIGFIIILNRQLNFLPKELGDIGKGGPGILSPQRPATPPAGTNPIEGPAQTAPGPGSQTTSGNQGQP